MEVNCFQILLIGVTILSLSHVLKVVLNVLIKNENPNICDTAGKGLKAILYRSTHYSHFGGYGLNVTLTTLTYFWINHKYHFFLNLKSSKLP